MAYEIKDNSGELLALIVPSTFRKEGIHFFTENEFTQQLAYMRHPSGKKIQPHVHNLVRREVKITQEVLFIRSGVVRADIFDNSRNYLNSYILREGDVILLASGGHGFAIIEDAEIIEVKQGPYAGSDDKVKFACMDDSSVRITRIE